MPSLLSKTSLSAVLGTEPAQRLRITRSLSAAAVYGVALAVQQHAVRLGLADGGAALALSGCIVLAVAGFYAAMRTGWSLRLADPGLTVPQMSLAIVLLVCAYAINAPVRGMLLMVVALVLVFGAFTLSPVNCRRLGAFAVAAMGATMAACALGMPDRFDPQVELIHFLFSVAVLPVIALFAGQLSGTRRKLKLQHATLQAALAASENAQRELAREQQRLANVIEGTHAGSWEWDLRTDAVRIDERWAQLLGYTLAELGSTTLATWRARTHRDDVPRSAARLEQHVAGTLPVYECELRLQHKQGHWVWLLARGKVLCRDTVGRPLQMAGTHMDISERKRIEIELHSRVEEASLQRQALDAISEPVLVKGPESKILWANRAFHEHYGMSNEQLLGIVDAPFVSPELTSQYLKEDAQVFASGRPLEIADSPVTRFDGTVLRWHVVKSPLFDSAGQVVGTVGVSRDMTAQLQARQALHDSQAFLDKTGRIGGVGGWAIDLATRTLQWTDQTCRILEVEPGHCPTAEEAAGYYPPQARETIEKAVRQSIASGESFDLELPLVTAGGRAIWVRAVAEVEFADGVPMRLVGAFQDITARREMEATLRRNNEVMASVLENLPCGLSAFDAELNLVAANTQYRHMFPLPHDLLEPVPMHFEQLIRDIAARGEFGTEDVEGYIQKALERARNPSPQLFERVRPDGSCVEVRYGPMPDGGLVATFTDISARRQAEAEARRSSELLRAAIDAIDEAFVLFDADDRLVFCNDKYRSLYGAAAHLVVPGVTFEAMVRAAAAFGLYATGPGGEEALIAERLAAHHRGDTTRVQRLVDGRIVRSIDCKMPDGHTVGFRVDITDLVNATDAAQAASVAKTQFLSTMSHELRTPMNAILGMLSLLRRTELTPRQADYAAKTDGAARALMGLLNQILDFSKIEAGRMTLEPQPFRIDSLLRELSVLLSANLGAKDVELLFDIDPALPQQWLLGDAMRLQQVLLNLGGNAIKFTASGEVVLSIALLAQTASGVMLEFAVRDTGIGIAAQDQARIFTGFTQAEGSTTRRFGGTGLGLAISQRLVQLMGGAIELDSTPGKGSRLHFRIGLPLAAQAPQDAPAPNAAATPGAAPRLLFVDDNAHARAAFARMGRSLGWDIALADSGEQALHMLRDGGRTGCAWQAVFVDLQMQGMDGLQTCERMRELGVQRTAPVVLMLGAQGRELLAQRSPTEQAAYDALLVKPVTASMLFDAVVDARAARQRPHPSKLSAAPSGSRLAGMHLLLVEDNANNQQVACELLEDEGARVQVAGDGQAAVQALAAAGAAFDVVLMDLHMPVMDGFTATRLIRQDPAHAALPIVAMTANALASDRDACLAAGMNEHVAKPFDLDHLVRVLRRYAWRHAPAEAELRPAAAATAAAESAAAEVAGVDLAAALKRMGGKRELYLRLLRNFVRDLGAMPAQLRAASGDAPQCLHLLHTLKGLAATVGARRLASAAAGAEMQLAAPPTPRHGEDALARVCTAIVAAGAGLDALAQVLQAVEDVKAAPSPEPAARAAPAAGQDAGALRPALQALAAQLRDADMAATDTMDALLQRFGPTWGAQLQPMHEAIEALDFAAALRLCDALAAVTVEEQAA